MCRYRVRHHHSVEKAFQGQVDAVLLERMPQAGIPIGAVAMIWSGIIVAAIVVGVVSMDYLFSRMNTPHQSSFSVEMDALEVAVKEAARWAVDCGEGERSRQ